MEQPWEMVNRIERMGKQPRVHIRQMKDRYDWDREHEYWGINLKYEDDSRRIEE